MIKSKECRLYQNGLCSFPYNPEKPGVTPSCAAINPKARGKNFPSNMLALRCTARSIGPLGELSGPNATAQETCIIPARGR